MRHEPTLAEKILWLRVRGDQLGVRFRRQHPIGSFIADFYCHEQKLVVELDGDPHDEQRAYDAARRRYFSSRGLQEIRFENEDVIRNIDGVLELIAQFCKPSPPPSPRVLGEGVSTLTNQDDGRGEGSSISL